MPPLARTNRQNDLNFQRLDCQVLLAKMGAPVWFRSCSLHCQDFCFIGLLGLN